MVTSGTGPLEDAAVVLEPAKPVKGKPGHTVSIEQRNRDFLPFLTIVQTGTTVDFPNRDPVKHHVYSFSPAKMFEIKLYAGKPTQPILFDKPGEVALGCNIHDWMEAYVMVVNSPYFAKTGADGRARIANVPPGHYRLRIWHPHQKADAGGREIDIGTSAFGTTAALEITPAVAKHKPPMDASSY
jgi:plastocyanin